MRELCSVPPCSDRWRVSRMFPGRCRSVSFVLIPIYYFSSPVSFMSFRSIFSLSAAPSPLCSSLFQFLLCRPLPPVLVLLLRVLFSLSPVSFPYILASLAVPLPPTLLKRKERCLLGRCCEVWARKSDLYTGPRLRWVFMISLAQLRFCFAFLISAVTSCFLLRLISLLCRPVDVGAHFHLHSQVRLSFGPFALALVV